MVVVGSFGVAVVLLIHGAVVAVAAVANGVALSASPSPFPFQSSPQPPSSPRPPPLARQRCRCRRRGGRRACCAHHARRGRHGWRGDLIAARARTLRCGTKRCAIAQILRPARKKPEASFVHQKCVPIWVNTLRYG